jgi:hypothetical protein
MFAAERTLLAVDEIALRAQIAATCTGTLLVC